MTVLQAIVLGAVQGLTEFIPISSSGHLVVVPEALGWGPPDLSFDVLLHSASLIALVVYFRAELARVARSLIRPNGDGRRLLWLLAIGTVPSAAAGLLFGDFFEDAFKDAEAAAIQIVITAIILVAGELFYRRHSAARHLRTMDELNTGDAAVIGVAQAISILPGISRSGATISAGLGLATSRDDAARFSFLLAIPALLGATLIEVPELRGSELGWGPGIAGFLVSLVTSYAAIAGLIRYLRTRSLYPFAVYCVIGGAVFYVLV